MEEENKKEDLELPASWNERAKYICRYLAVLFCHQFLFELDLDGVLTNLPEFMEFLFGLISSHKDTLVSRKSFSNSTVRLATSGNSLLSSSAP